jgi:malonyl-CoA/methylmalonyl-CoA synthetase
MRASTSERPPSLEPALSRSRLQTASAAPSTFSRTRFYRLSAGSFFKTGDLAARSADGYYTLLERKSDVIISGGFNVYPREIEEFLEEQEEVADAAVLGIPDRVRGEMPVVFVVLRSSVDLAILEARCRERFASFKVPRAYVPMEQLPRNALGKIQKHLLLKDAGSM